MFFIRLFSDSDKKEDAAVKRWGVREGVVFVADFTFIAWVSKKNVKGALCRQIY